MQAKKDKKEMTSWPMHGDRFICTKENPKPKDATGKWADVSKGNQRDGYPSGDIVEIKCNACGEEWEEELPQ